MPDTRGSILTLPLPTDFHLPTVVCSYGYYVLAPNKWDPEQATLDRPLLLDTGKRIDTRTTQRGRSLRITCNAKLARSEQHEVKERITRMLRIDEDLRAWYASHREAKSKRWGRLFRSPTLFEDII
ncbi:MAG: hypothetical protein MI741_14840, partial [Rhodospirillales bacterium]|nr:hypothetical protein [Rhodospirillales bacterium]